jgi:hypothetical protein
MHAYPNVMTMCIQTNACMYTWRGYQDEYAKKLNANDLINRTRQ